MFGPIDARRGLLAAAAALFVLPPLRAQRAHPPLGTGAATPSAAAAVRAPRNITSPREQFGFAIGDDYRLVTYTQFDGYWRRLARESDRMRLVEIGTTAEGRPQLMAIISAPRNLARLDQFRRLNRRLALGEAPDSQAARALARAGRSIVWIDGGLHATEVLGAAQLIETVYQLLARDDAETRRILDDCIILAVHANPDGMELVSEWYMKDADTLRRNLQIPRLYQKYVGHDNNRDFYMSNQPETRNINHVLYWDWFPQIVYNHHQTGPAGTVMFAPPFRDPFNFNLDPLVVTELDLVGAAMHSRFAAEGKPGVTMRSGSTYSTWWNGGLRTTPYFHNMIGLLTETIGSPTPQTIPFVPAQQLPRADLPFPIAPQRWHFRQSVEYSLTANRAVLDIASRERENLLFNSWRMARNSIERGSRDSWTASPHVVEAVTRSAAPARPAPAAPQTVGPVGDPVYQYGRGLDPGQFTRLLRAPERRDARGYILPRDQPDFLTAVRFVNALRHVGVTVHRATAPFVVNGRAYGAGSFVVKAAQPFRPMVRDMFEPQDHPNDFAYPGGPPRRPYDNAGYTLAYQMGVRFDRVLDGFDGPFEEVQGLASPPPAMITAVEGAQGFLLSRAMNEAVVAVNRALAAGVKVYQLRSPFIAAPDTLPAGTFYVTATPASIALLHELAHTRGLPARGVPTAAPPDASELRRPRVALLDRYGGSMPSGHTRWILEQFEFPYDVVYPRALDAGIVGRYDVLVLPSGAMPRGEAETAHVELPVDSSLVPPAYADRLGRITRATTVPQLRRFLEAGGTIVAVGTSAVLGTELGLPISSALVERGANGAERPLGADRFYVPGSILRVRVDTTRLVSAGLPRDLDVFYDNSPAFRLGSDSAVRGVTPLAWFEGAAPLRSGWAWGQHHLDGAIEAVEARIGKGTLYLFAPEITFRGQSYGTFKWLFNALYGGT